MVKYGVKSDAEKLSVVSCACGKIKSQTQEINEQKAGKNLIAQYPMCKNVNK